VKVLLAIPRYRFIWPCAERWLVEALTEITQAGHQVGYVPGDDLAGLYYDEALQAGCELAVQDGFDVFLTCDQDQYLSGSDTARLVTDCIAGDWAMLAAPYVCRGRADPSWMQPEEGHEATTEDLTLMRSALTDGIPLECRGFVGSGTAAVNVKHLADMERPWWFRASPGLFGEDVWFCRRAREAGKRIGVHFGLRSAEHWGARVYQASAMLDRVAQLLDQKLAAVG